MCLLEGADHFQGCMWRFFTILLVADCKQAGTGSAGQYIKGDDHVWCAGCLGLVQQSPQEQTVRTLTCVSSPQLLVSRSQTLLAFISHWLSLELTGHGPSQSSYLCLICYGRVLKL